MSEVQARSVPCSKCGEPREVGQGCKPCAAARKRSRYAANPEKERARSAAYSAANPEKERARRAAYRAANPEKVREWFAAYRAANLEKLRAWSAAYSAANPEKGRERSAVRRARQRRASVVERVQLAALYERDKGVCQLCHKKVKLADASIDHIIPISKDETEHSYRNTQLAHLRCNSARGNRGPAQIRMLP